MSRICTGIIDRYVGWKKVAQQEVTVLLMRDAYILERLPLTSQPRSSLLEGRERLVNEGLTGGLEEPTSHIYIK